MLAEDRELIRRLLAGEAAAVEQIASWTALAAQPYRQRLGGDWEDAVQDVQLEVLQLLRGDRFDGRSSLKTYLWRITSHTCLDRLRALGRRSFFDLATIAEVPDARAESPADAAARRDENALLWRALGEVPAPCRQLLGWIVAGLSYRQMSDRLGVAEGTLRVRVLRCRQKALEARDRLLGSGRL